MKSIAPRFLFLFLLLVFSCAKDNQNANPVPYVAVNTSLNTSNPVYSDLNREGGYYLLSGYGNKGIIIIHDFSDNFWAFDRTCPYHVTSPCGIVTMATSGLNLVCGTYNGKNLNACCASTYNLDGTVTHGPSTYALRRYQVNVSGDNISGYILTVTN